MVERFLFWALVGGIVGTGAELLLLGHFESANQLPPLVLLGLSVPVIAWHSLRPRGPSVLVIRLLMVLFLLASGVGIGLHYLGNREFELEMYPSAGGTTLFGKSMTGATPVLAPGSMALLGLVGLAYTFSGRSTS